MTSAFKTSDECSIDYSLHAANRANAPRLVLIHSLALDRELWDGVVRELSGHAHILALDCRGHGKSGKPAGPYTVELFARDLAELMDHIGWPPAVIAGCSMGGCVAQAFAGAYPQKTSALALIDTTAWYGADAARQWRERAKAARTKGLSGMVDFQVTRWFSEAFRAGHPGLVQATTRVFLANPVGVYALTCEMLGAADLRPLQAQMKMPVAVVVGEEDYATPVAMARQIHENVAGSTLTILPAARHLSPIESPQAIAASLRTLLAGSKG